MQAIKLADIYSYMIANWLNGGNFVRRNQMQATDICPDYNMIFTKGAIKQVYRIAGIKPENVDLCFVDYIRDEMFSLNPDVEVIINISNQPTKLNITNDKFSRAMSRASEAYNSYKEAYDSQSGLASLTGKTYRLSGGGRLRLSKEKLDDLRQMFLSYLYLYQYVSSGGTVTLTEVFIELIGQNVRDIRRASDDLYGILGPFNVGIEQVKGMLKTYLNHFGPAVPMPTRMHKKFMPQLLFSDEDMTAFTSYKSRGLVGESGLLLGMDFRARLPFMLDIFTAPSAQVFLLMGKTGSGKTYAAFQAALSALAMGEYVTAIDIKGREWTKIAPFAEHKVITFDEKNPSFVNTMRLDDLDVDLTNASELFNIAINGTVKLCMLVVNLQNEGNPSDLEIVLREAILKLYSLKRVDVDNPLSFKASSTISYADILPVLESLATTESYTQEQRDMVHLARARLNSYFGPFGLFSDAFKNEITLGDVLSTPLVIYEFNKNQNTMVDSLDVIRVFMVQYLDSKKQAMLRAKDKFLFSFYEELQRAPAFGTLLEYICHQTTGSRSNNAVIFLLLNSMKVLQGKEGQDIRSNITSIICGFVEDNDIDSLETEFARPWLAGQLRLFRDKQNIYRNCFAVEADPGYGSVLRTVYKVQFPDSMSTMFRTRTIRDT